MWIMPSYMKLAEKEKERGEAKFPFYQLGCVELVSTLIVISWGRKSLWTSSSLEPGALSSTVPRTSGRK
jgi:hypothetical protein